MARKLSHAVVNGRTLVNLEAFAPAGALGVDFITGSSPAALGVGLVTYSYTQLAQYLACPLRYRYRYLDGWQEKRNPSWAAVRTGLRTSTGCAVPP